jgi:hypothetical protein
MTWSQQQQPVHVLDKANCKLALPAAAVLTALTHCVVLRA